MDLKNERKRLSETSKVALAIALIGLIGTFVIVIVSNLDKFKKTQESVTASADRLNKQHTAGRAIAFAWAQLTLELALQQNSAEYNHLEDPCLVVLKQKYYDSRKELAREHTWTLDFKNVLEAFVYGPNVWVVARVEPFEKVTTNYPSKSKHMVSTDRILLPFQSEERTNAVLIHFNSSIESCRYD